MSIKPHVAANPTRPKTSTYHCPLRRVVCGLSDRLIVVLFIILFGEFLVPEDDRRPPPNTHTHTHTHLRVELPAIDGLEAAEVAQVDEVPVTRLHHQVARDLLHCLEAGQLGWVHGRDGPLRVPEIKEPWTLHLCTWTEMTGVQPTMVELITTRILSTHPLKVGMRILMEPRIRVQFENC